MSAPSRRARTRYSSADDFFRRHNLLPVSGQSDEHYAERLFIKEAFLPTFGLAGLSYLTPQAAFVDSAKRERRIDFLLDTGSKYALEIEGRSYHAAENQNAARFNNEKARQRELARAGYQYLPFSYGDIRGEVAEAHLGDIAVTDPVLLKLLRASQERAGRSARRPPRTASSCLNRCWAACPRCFRSTRRR